MRTGSSIAACLVSLSLVASIAACSSDDGAATSGGGGTSTSTGSGDSGCGVDPFACPTGQTCWPSGPSLNDVTLECLNSGPGQAGDACQNILNQPACADGLACFAVAGYPIVCTPFCDPKDAAHACTSGSPCVQLTLQGTSASYHVCQPDASASSGAGGGGGASSTGSDGTGGAAPPGTGGSGGA